jgi:cell division protein FtsB
MSLRQIIIIILVICGILGAIYFYLPNYSKFQELQSKEDTIQRQIDTLKAEVTRMQEEKYLLEHDVMYLEKVVREKLGRVEPGETVYKVIDTTIDDEDKPTPTPSS